MNNLFSIKMVSKIALILSCLALADRKSSDALLLGNLIGCNSFGCRISALESDVSILKQQVARLSGDQSISNGGLNNFRPNMNQNPYNNQMNQLNPNQLNPNQLNQNAQMQNQDTFTNNNSSPRVNYANYLPDYPINQQQLRRNNGYQNGLNNQFFNN